MKKGIVFALASLLSFTAATVYADDATSAPTDGSIFGLFRSMKGGHGKDSKEADPYLVDRYDSGLSKSATAVEELPSQYRDPWEKQPFKPGTRKAIVNMYGSVQGLKGVLYGDLPQTLNGHLKSPLAIQNITWSLTEPGVAAGMQQATTQGLLLSQNKMLAEQNFLNQLNYHPEIRDPVAQAYLACVANSGGASNGNGDADGWTEAIANCMKDNGVGKGLTFAEDPNHVVLEGGFEGEALAERDRTIFLSEYLFTQEAYRAGSGSSVMSLEGFIKIQKDFKKYIGDLQIAIHPRIGEGGESPGQDISFAKIPAQTTATDYLKNKDSEGNPGRIEQVYNMLLGVMYDRCKFLNPSGSGATSGSGSAADAKEIWVGGNKPDDRREFKENEAKTNFWKNKELFKEEVQKELSIEGFPFNESFGELVYNRTIKGKTCGVIDPKSSVFMYKYTNLTVKDDRILATPEQRYLYAIAFRIARAQVIDSLITMEEFISNLTVGTFDNNFVKPRALQLIYEAVGTNDLRGLYETNLLKYADLVKEMVEYVAEGSGSGGRTMFTSSSSTERTGPGLSPMGG
jgi:hypothetical protein